jgi:predicted component of type VI protein secretion system
MESAAERKSIYQELLTESFEHLAKQLPKTNKAAVQQLLEQLKEDQELNANKYFGIYKLAINSKDPKAISMALDAIDKLVNTGFLDGNCEESSIDLDLEKPKEGDKNQKDARESRRKLIDTIVETVCSCKRERSDDIQKQLINVLTIIATKLKNIVHGNNLQRILETLSHVYTVSRNQENQATAKVL